MGNKSYENNFKNMDEIKDKVAIVLGKTGVGKSTFINCITNNNLCEVGDDTNSCTQNIKQVDRSRNGFNYYFVDIPGLDDGKGDDENINELKNLNKLYPRINALIICVDFHENRLCNSFKIVLKTFMEIFPCQNFWNHVIIVRTKSQRGNSFENMKKKNRRKITKWNQK